MRKLMLTLMIILLSTIIMGYKLNDEDNSKVNEKLAQAIIKEEKINYNNNDRYVYYYEDLNEDNKDEVIVYLWGSDFSGTGGGTMMIFNQNKDEYNLISKTTLVNMPILISENMTNGYKDIIVKVEGGGIEKSFDALLQYKNNKYPLNPSIQPEVDINKVKIKKEINTLISPNRGFPLSCK